METQENKRERKTKEATRMKRKQTIKKGTEKKIKISTYL